MGTQLLLREQQATVGAIQTRHMATPARDTVGMEGGTDSLEGGMEDLVGTVGATVGIIEACKPKGSKSPAPSREQPDRPSRPNCNVPSPPNRGVCHLTYT